MAFVRRMDKRVKGRHGMKTAKRLRRSLFTRFARFARFGTTAAAATATAFGCNALFIMARDEGFAQEGTRELGFDFEKRFEPKLRDGGSIVAFQECLDEFCRRFAVVGIPKRFDIGVVFGRDIARLVGVDGGDETRGIVCLAHDFKCLRFG